MLQRDNIVSFEKYKRRKIFHKYTPPHVVIFCFIILMMTGIATIFAVIGAIYQ